jgi:sugar lactone lactonase YvrE
MYQQRDPSFLGIIGLFDAVYLPLKQGDNELMLAVFESFGGWGFMCRDGEAVFEHADMTKAWELKRTFKLPESVVYDEKRDILYVSNYFNDGREFISKVTLDGDIETLEWITGVDRPTGMCIYRDTLYIAEQRRLAVVDLDAGAIVSQIEIPGAQFLNDIAFDMEGNCYISDSRISTIYKLADGEAVAWLQGGEVNDPNGMLIDDDRLLLGNSGDGCLKSISLEDKSIETIVCLGEDAIMDGLVSDGRGNYIISDFNGRMFLVAPSGSKTLMLDTSAPEVYCADFAYILEKQLIVVPTLYENRIAAYKYSPSQ